MKLDENTPEKVPVNPGNARLERSGDNDNPSVRGIGAPPTSTGSELTLSEVPSQGSSKLLSEGLLPENSVENDDKSEGNARLERSGDNDNPSVRGIGAPPTSTEDSESSTLRTQEYYEKPNSEQLNSSTPSEGLFVAPTGATNLKSDGGEESLEKDLQAIDRPFWSLFKQVLLVGAIAVLLLTAVGVFMGLTGLKTPHISGDAVWKQFQHAIGEDTAYHDWNELEKNER